MHPRLARPLAALLTTLLLALSALVAGLVAGAGTASAAADVRHSGPNWVWFGPKDWDASYGTYGITVTSANGKTVLDLGFSSTLCSPGATWDKSVANYFAAQRQALKNNGVTITAKSAIAHPSGMPQMYRRQVLDVATSGNGPVKGKVVLDYDFSTTVDGVNYCYQRSIGLTAPVKRWADDKVVLKRVWDSLAYSGPGAYEDDE